MKSVIVVLVHWLSNGKKK